MKKLITIIALAVLASCSKEDAQCECTAYYQTEIGVYGINGMPIDCETGYPTQAPTSGGYFLYCD